MKRLVLSILMVVLLGWIPMMAQDYPTEVVNGKTCYKYVVQKGEGLYRISTKFGVSQEEIVNLNPHLRTDGLRLDEVIYVPVVKPKEESDDYIKHVIQPQETLYGLSKQYGVPQADIFALNGEAAKRMAIGSVLLIPRVSSTLPLPATAAVSTPAPIVESAPAPAVAEQTHAEDKTTNVIAQVETTKPTPQDTTVPQPLTPMPAMQTIMDTLVTSEAQLDGQILPVRIAYLLPLMASNTKRDERFVEFYEGALLALKKMENKGQRIEIYTYDIEKNDDKLNEILMQPELQNMDLIIGPAYPSQVQIVGNFAYLNHIPTIVPFTSHVAGIESNPYLMQFNPAEEREAEALCSALLADKTKYHFIFVDGGNEEKTTNYQAIESEVKKQGISCANVSVRRILSDSLLVNLSAERTNVMVINTDKYSNLQTIMPKLEEATKNYSVLLVGKYSYTRENGMVDLLYSSVFNEVEDSLLLNEYSEMFNRYFTKNLTTDAPRYDLLGYDITSYALLYLHAKAMGNGDINVSTLNYKGLQSNIRFVHVDTQEGYQNSELQVIQLNMNEYSWGEP